MRILLGVCGSVAAYKTFDLARGLTKNGHEVKVILTKGALNFLKPELYRYLGVEEVYSPNDDFNYPKNKSDGNVLHIELAKWAEHFLIYPASANTLANLAFGKADDLLTSVFLAKRENCITSIFPAMNTLMYTHPLTQENMDLLRRIHKANNLFIHPPAKGKLACGDEGEGKAPEVSKVINCIEAINPNINNDSKLALITTGATIAPIDPVRFVTNPSSGKTGFTLAKECLRRGYRVHIIAGQNATPDLEDLSELPGFSIQRIVTTNDMKEAVSKIINKADLYISSAAISDIEFNMSNGKLKKSELHGELKFTKAPDILQFVMDNKRDELKTVGFAAETTLDFQTLSEKWNRKPTDLLVGTQVHSGLKEGHEQAGFNVNEAQYKFFKDGKIVFEGTLSKSDLPKQIMDSLSDV